MIKKPNLQIEIADENLEDKVEWVKEKPQEVKEEPRKETLPKENSEGESEYESESESEDKQEPENDLKQEPSFGQPPLADWQIEEEQQDKPDAPRRPITETEQTQEEVIQDQEIDETQIQKQQQEVEALMWEAAKTLED